MSLNADSSQKSLPQNSPSMRNGSDHNKEAPESKDEFTRREIPLNEKNLEEGELSFLKVDHGDVRIHLYNEKSPRSLDFQPHWQDYLIREDILRGLLARGYHSPSVIQQASLTLYFKYPNHHLIAQAMNGSGKTAAFTIIMLQKSILSVKFPQCICICHTRELALQNHTVVNQLGKFTGLTSWLCVPQCERYPKDNGAQIIVGTPGKLREMLMKRVFPSNNFSLFVVDEADILLDYASNMGAQILELFRHMPKSTQILLYSATFPARVEKFVSSFAPSANRIEIQRKKLSVPAIKQFYIECCDDDAKCIVLSDLYGSMAIGQSVIFVNTRQRAFALAQQLRSEDHPISLICGTQATGPEKMDIETRDRIMREFRNGETKVLIATDLLSRGIDVPQVTLVINYELPVASESAIVNFETYLHRIGRTGRFGAKGIAISLIAPREKSTLELIEEYYNCQIERFEDNYEDFQKIVEDLR